MHKFLTLNLTGRNVSCKEKQAGRMLICSSYSISRKMLLSNIFTFQETYYQLLIRYGVCAFPGGCKYSYGSY